MKKIILLIALLSAMFATSASGQVVKGDMNDDGKIDISDLNDIVNTVLGLKPLQYIQSLVVKGDMNDDCKIDVSDINEIVNTILGNSPLRYIHEYVDLGLPSGTLWATTNIGADCPEDFGLYFAWGETTGYAVDASDGHSFDWANYKWCKGSFSRLTKYCIKDEELPLSTSPDGKTILDAEDDAATANWGSGWCIPSIAQIEELYNSGYTTTEWTTVNGVYGEKITSKSNGNSIFLPAAGYRSAKNYIINSGGFYWSREIYLYFCCDAYYLRFSSSSIYQTQGSRCDGRSVRAVRATTAQ